MSSEIPDQTLYYFTRSYPYGNSPLWKMRELETLRDHFRKVVVVPLTFGADQEAANVVEGAEYLAPIVDREFSRTNRAVWEKVALLIGLLRTPVVRYFFEELLDPRVLFRPRRIRDLLRATYEIALFRKSSVLQEIFQTASRADSYFYFFWGIGQVNALLLRRPDGLPFSACRFHGWDLYEDRHETEYIPYRRQLLKMLDLLLPCSADGERYLAARSGSKKSKISVARLGAITSGRSPMHKDGVLKIVTVSNMVSVKRLDLLCEGLLKTTIPVQWTHIGDGELMPMVRAYAERFPPNVKVDLRGAIPASEVATALAAESFDLFINTSISEGVPVSVMEAFAAGIPVYATDVGGTAEIVDDSVGKLMPSTIDQTNLSSEIEEFFLLPEDRKLEMRDNAFRRFQERCDAQANSVKLAKLLVAAAKK